MFKRERRKIISCEEFAERLHFCKENRLLIYGAKGNRSLRHFCAYLEMKQVSATLTYRDNDYIVCTYVTRLDEQNQEGAVTGLEAYRILSHYFKVPDLRKHPVLKQWCGGAREGKPSASPIQYINPKYDGKHVRAYGYDINSAYSYAMIQPMPDTTRPAYRCLIPEGHMGFKIVEDDDGKRTVISVTQGYADVVFPLVESPFKRFVQVWYDRKRKAKSGSPERAKAKSVLNNSIGYLQRINPFYRTAIITYCNNNIKQHMDENTLTCNTDSIVSVVPREDLPISDKIGDFKVEHDGYCFYRGSNFQWDGERAHVRGVHYSQVSGDFNLQTDKPRPIKLPWRIDWDRCMLVKVGEHEVTDTSFTPQQLKQWLEAKKNKNKEK